MPIYKNVIIEVLDNFNTLRIKIIFFIEKLF